MFTTTVKPRFYETDAFGHVNNTVISAWFETAREPIFRIFSAEMNIREISIILAKIEVNFVAQIHYGTKVLLKTSIGKIGNSSFTVEHEAWQNGALAAKGNAVQVYFDFSTQKSGPLPDEFRLALEQHLIEEN
jgi:acyl-CoA thioester hydrolase